MLEQVIDKSVTEFLEIAKEEEDGDYGDAMLSMERTEAYGRVEGLQVAYEIVFGKAYASPIGFDND